MDLLEFARGPALQAAAYILVAGTIWRIVGIVLLKEKPDFSEPRQRAGVGFVGAQLNGVDADGAQGPQEVRLGLSLAFGASTPW